MRCPFAEFRGPIPNMTQGQVNRPARGLVLHVIVGSLMSADAAFHNPGWQASAYFGAAKDGHLVQWVDTDDKAWAEVAGNRDWYSVETEGLPSEALTDAQLTTVAKLLAWLAQHDGFPIQVTDDVNGQGLITHKAGGMAWGNHDCPGAIRTAQRPEIVRRALQMAAPAPQTRTAVYALPITMKPVVAAAECPTGGFWLVSADGDVYAFLGAPFRPWPTKAVDFAGRTVKSIAPGADGVHPYVITATTEETYRP